VRFLTDSLTRIGNSSKFIDHGEVIETLRDEYESMYQSVPKHVLKRFKTCFYAVLKQSACLDSSSIVHKRVMKPIAERGEESTP